MKFQYLLAHLLLPLCCLSQNDHPQFRSKSWQTYAYRINAADAEKYVKWDSIPVGNFTTRQADRVFATDSVNEDELATGNYVLLHASEYYVKASYRCISKLKVLYINNGKQLQLDIRNGEGRFNNDAIVFVNNEKALLNKDSKTYWVKSNRLDDAIIKVYALEDTLFSKLIQKESDNVQSISQQRKKQYRLTKFYRALKWFPAKLQQLFNRSNAKRNYRTGASGFIVFNQPKYKPLDTVKFKGYIVNKHARQYKGRVNIYLSYNSKGKIYNQLISVTNPVSAGAYIGQFVLADTIPPDIECRLIFKSTLNKDLIQNKFSIEEYVLDEIGSYTFSSEKENYFRNDSMRFFAAAKDGNGLNVMDGFATLILTTTNVTNFYQDTIFIADTIYRKELPLLTSGNTRFAVAAVALPAADINIKATLIFQNSNNELHEETKSVTFKYQSREIVVTRQEDSIRAVYIEDGIEKSSAGEMGMNDEEETMMQFPVSFKIDPLASDYSFYINSSDGKVLTSAYKEIETNYQLGFVRISAADTLGFVLNNPYKVPVYFTVFDGNNIVATGRQTYAKVAWQMKAGNHRRLYKVRWQYIWAGEEQSGEESLGLLYKMLSVNLHTNPTVYPGQRDSIRISVKDYMGKPAANVNLTAVSYNNQFGKNIRVQEPPYLAKYKAKKSLRYPAYQHEEDGFSIEKQYQLATHKQLISQWKLDTMHYYQLLFPENKMADVVTLINNFLPQISVNIVKQGVPQDIYLLYINRRLVYYNGVTDTMKYCYEVDPYNVQLTIRLRDRLIEIDSLYIQPNYKHQLSFDIDQLPPHSKVTLINNYWSQPEMNLLEQSIFQLKNSRVKDGAFVWQGNSLVRFKGNRTHLAGPFSRSQLTFFNPGDYDINFQFEPGYEYTLSPGILRLEKKALFPRRDINNLLPLVIKPRLIIGDTIVAAPPIFYPEIDKPIFLKQSTWEYFNRINDARLSKGRLHFNKPKDSSFAYFILEPLDTSNRRRIIYGSYNNYFHNVDSGKYALLLITHNNYIAQLNNISVAANGITCINTSKALYSRYNKLVDDIISQQQAEAMPLPAIIKKEVPEIVYTPALPVIYYTDGATVTGTITDNKGRQRIPGATILIMQLNQATSGDANGNYILRSIKPGNYTLQISSVGYETQNINITAGKNENLLLNIVLNATSKSLSEVVVVGYGTTRKVSMTGAVSVIRSSDLSINNELMGRASGVYVTPDEGEPGNSISIMIRGITSQSGGNAPLYIVDGILLEKAPAFNPDNIQDISILNQAEAVAMYGARAANGVIIITTKAPSLRKQFRDYALWQPNFFTDKNGSATVAVNYPDNITGWKTFVIAMDKKRRIGKATVLTQAYKPIVAELSVPQFLVQGDSVAVIGKSKNYTADYYTVATEFTLHNKAISAANKMLQPKVANIESVTLGTGSFDTIKVAFQLQTSTGYSDGEERTIPVFTKGMEETIGKCWLLQNDTVVSFATVPGVQQLHLYAQNNTVDWMLQELDNLRSYPYHCMEQTASKMMGLIMEKKIRSHLNQPFKYQQELDKLLQKIKKGQLFDGGWSWWENGQPNFYITNYITNTLLELRSDPMVALHIRNAFLYLYNMLPSLKYSDLLAALSTLSNGRHEMDYKPWLDKINYDSLNEHQRWQWVTISKNAGFTYQPQLSALVKAGTSSVLGGVYWGTSNFSWYSNEVATTVLAYRILRNEPLYSEYPDKIIQYFLESRSKGYWNNTVETATILHAMLPVMLSAKQNFNNPATISVSGDTVMLIKRFPYSIKLPAANIKNLNFSKAGGGLIYFTAYQKVLNSEPIAVQDNFLVNTFFEKDHQIVRIIKAGEKIKMIVNIHALKDASFVQIEIPIPAGCNYASRLNGNRSIYKEYYKNKVILFTEAISKGIHQYEIELEPRYTGSFTLNPAKASLMYFPTFYGNNEMKRIVIF